MIDNAIMAQQLICFMHKTKMKKGVVDFKIDLNNAYDKVDRIISSKL